MKALEEREAVVLTPEHVPIRLFPAGLGARFFALLVDAGVILAVSSMLSTMLGLLSGFRIVLVFVLSWGYHVFFEVRHQGRSPGKRLCGLRVVDSRGLPVTFQQSFVRNVVRVVDAAPAFYGAGALISLLDRRSRRLGDIAADTLVIEERSAGDPTAAISGARRFNSLQNPRVLRRLRRQVGLEEREFLLALCLRADYLETRARFDLMEEVGGHYRRTLEVDDPNLSGENLVRGLLAVLYTDRA
ncbi:MAG TPA: RDD family protein [Planctomycetota bacterium]|nr:RDD family protein [Planctomycetota bacterium]